MEVDLKVELVRQGMVRLPRGTGDVRTKTIERVTRHDRSAEAAYPADRTPGVPPVGRKSATVGDSGSWTAEAVAELPNRHGKPRWGRRTSRLSPCGRSEGRCIGRVDGSFWRPLSRM